MHYISVGLLFFFFKQKTAYEMRISDWSSDVCSSDLLPAGDRRRDRPADRRVGLCQPGGRAGHRLRIEDLLGFQRAAQAGAIESDVAVRRVLDQRQVGVERERGQIVAPPRQQRARSEEHTSELQSLMRISYAVFCLKKKKKIKHRLIHRQIKRTTHN